jgi:uncharacterized phage protein gp47/JayE
MPWPIPAPGDIFSRCAAVFEAQLPGIFAAKNPSAPPATVDARSNTSQLAVYCRTVGAAVYDLWFFLPRVVQELMLDTAIYWVPRHAAMWGVPQNMGTVAIGNVIFTEPPETNIPSALALTAGGQSYVTTATATVPGGGSVSVPVAAVVAGSAGSQPAGTVLTLVNPQGGFTIQSAIVDAGGLVGTDAESIASWRSRTLARVRQRGLAGNQNDFVQWVREVYPTAIATAYRLRVGEVVVAFAMPNGSSWQVPTTDQINAVSAYINNATLRKPLGSGTVNVIAATLTPINFTIALNPDTAANETGATNALTLQILGDATIGGVIYINRLNAALENASGEFSHEMIAPSGDIGGTPSTLLVMGTVTF